MPRKTNIQLRRGSYSAWGSVNPVLDEGEPGYDTTNKAIKIGDALSSWTGLPEVILSVSPTVENGGSKAYPLVLSSPEVNFKNTGETNIFTVPTGYLFLIDRMEVVTTSISSAGTAPYFRFGKSGSSSAFLSATQSQSNSQGARHVIDSPQDGESSGTVVTFGVTAASTATTHKGIAIIRGYLVGATTDPTPTSTPVPPTSTPVPPTSTPVPPTSTPVPPTSTPTPTLAPPSTPTGLAQSSCACETGTGTIVWNSVANATSYVLEWSSSPGGSFSEAFSGAGTSTNLYIEGLGGMVYLRVKAVNAAGSSSWSSEVLVTCTEGC